MFSTAAAPFYMPADSTRGFQFLRICQVVFLFVCRHWRFYVHEVNGLHAVWFLTLRQVRVAAYQQCSGEHHWFVGDFVLEAGPVWEGGALYTRLQHLAALKMRLPVGLETLSRRCVPSRSSHAQGAGDRTLHRSGLWRQGKGRVHVREQGALWSRGRIKEQVVTGHKKSA